MFQLLIVDDELGIRSGVARYFPWAGLDISVAGTCENGAEALQFLARNPVDLVLSDIRMPKMDGLRFAEIVRERGYRCEIVFISAHKDFEYARRAIGLGVKHYIVKPAGYEELHEVFSRIVAELRKERSREPEPEDLHSGPAEPLRSDARAGLLERAGLVVERSLATATLVSVAEQLGMSPNHFSFRFHSETGKTFSQFLLEVRMKRARELLRDGRSRVYEVSRSVGYASVKSFARSCKSYFGLSPRELQKAEG